MKLGFQTPQSATLLPLGYPALLRSVVCWWRLETWTTAAAKGLRGHPVHLGARRGGRRRGGEGRGEGTAGLVGGAAPKVSRFTHCNGDRNTAV